MNLNFLSRTVVILGLVSFLNDAASEMITPLLPLYLTATLGAGPAIVGLVEGVAEASSSALKLFAGYLADRGWNSKNLVIGGYSLSNTARPLIGLSFGWSWVFLLRFIDRVGKGLRTSPRDAMIALSTESHLRGRAFGFHRALDHAGAVLGPLIAFMLLSYDFDLQSVFMVSVIPGILVVLLLIFALPDVTRNPENAVLATKATWHSIDIRLKALIVTTSGIALATTPEVFLVLWAQTHGLAIVWVPLLWATASAVKVVVAIPGGYSSDRYGRLPVLITGWSMRIILLIALGFTATNEHTIWFLFLTYAASLAITEGAERALIGDFAPAGQKATAFGLYHMTNGLFILPGAVLFGALWQWFGERTAFITAAGLTTVSVIILLIMILKQNRNSSNSV